MSSEAFAATTTLEPETGPAEGAVSDTVGGVASFATVTRTALANPFAVVLSFATAERKCVPFAVDVVSHEMAYGLTAPGEPRSTPSSLNCKLEMVPDVDEAVAVTATAAPETVAPIPGADSETVTGDVAIPVPVSSAAVKTSNE